MRTQAPKPFDGEDCVGICTHTIFTSCVCEVARSRAMHVWDSDCGILDLTVQRRMGTYDTHELRKAGANAYTDAMLHTSDKPAVAAVRLLVRSELSNVRGRA